MSLTPGTLNAVELGQRDAFHVPAIQVFSEDEVSPGDCVVFSSYDEVYLGKKESCQAIVDPFLNGTIKPGMRFWAWLMPGLVDNLIHSFSAKGVPEKPVPQSKPYVPDPYEEEDECSGCNW